MTSPSSSPTEVSDGAAHERAGQRTTSLLELGRDPCSLIATALSLATEDDEADEIACDTSLAALARTKAFSSLDKDQILRVLLIGDAFAHQFGKQEALYETASALRHDCAPNCRFRSQPDGSIEVTSIRHIPAGETLSFSYIGVPWVLCTSERRKLLRESFEFFCACRRC